MPQNSQFDNLPTPPPPPRLCFDPQDRCFWAPPKNFGCAPLSSGAGLLPRISRDPEFSQRHAVNRYSAIDIFAICTVHLSKHLPVIPAVAKASAGTGLSSFRVLWPLGMARRTFGATCKKMVGSRDACRHGIVSSVHTTSSTRTR